MGDITILPAPQARGAMERLYQEFREGLPDSKRKYTPVRLPPTLAAPPGLLCFEKAEPVAALYWHAHEAENGFILPRFYAESSRASIQALQLLMDEFLARTAAASVHHFELWTRPEARVHAILEQAGFDSLRRELLLFTKPIPAPDDPADCQLTALQDCRLDINDLDDLAQALHRIYRDTPDGAFYHQFSSPACCRAYLDRVLNSPLCDVRNSWLAWSLPDHRIAGMLLCHHWPIGRSIYVEQLGVVPEFRGRRLATTLLGRVARALENACAQGVLLTVTSANKVARRLYYQLGADLLDHERAYTRRGFAGYPMSAQGGSIL